MQLNTQILNGSLKRSPMGDRRQGYDKQPENSRFQEYVKIFVSNFPEKCSGKDLDDLVKGHGEVSKIYIARKRDKVGRRFGFVTFKDVRDSEVLVNSLSTIWMGSYKLRFNIARFTESQEENNRPFVNPQTTEGGTGEA